MGCGKSIAQDGTMDGRSAVSFRGLRPDMMRGAFVMPLFASSIARKAALAVERLDVVWYINGGSHDLRETIKCFLRGWDTCRGRT